MPVQFDVVWSTRYFPVYPVSESCLDVIKDYYLSLRPRLVFLFLPRVCTVTIWPTLEIVQS